MLISRAYILSFMALKLTKTTSLAAIITAIGCGTAAPQIAAPEVTGPLRPIVPAEQYHVEELVHDNFDSWVQESDLPVVVDFYSPTCGPCREVKPVFNKVCADMQGQVYCASYNTAQDRGMENRVSPRFDVRYVPGWRFFNNGAEDAERRQTGGMDEQELRSMIESFVESCNQ